MSFPFSMQVWGSLRSTKRALLLHGGVESAVGWAKVAEGLVKAGYRVDAPDLSGHGWSAATTSDQNFKTHAQHVQDNLDPQVKYDVLAGISFGAAVALYLFKSMTTKPPKLVLVEPAFDHAIAPQWAGVCKMLESPPPVQGLMAKFNRSEKEASADRLGLLQIDIPALSHVFTDNPDMTFHQDLPEPSEAPDTSITLIGADATKGGLWGFENAKFMKEHKSHVKIAWCPGYGHKLNIDRPEVILHAILEDKLVESEWLRPL